MPRPNPRREGTVGPRPRDSPRRLGDAQHEAGRIPSTLTPSRKASTPNKPRSPSPARPSIPDRAADLVTFDDPRDHGAGLTTTLDSGDFIEDLTKTSKGVRPSRLARPLMTTRRSLNLLKDKAPVIVWDKTKAGALRQARKAEPTASAGPGSSRLPQQTVRSAAQRRGRVEPAADRGCPAATQLMTELSERGESRSPQRRDMMICRDGDRAKPSAGSQPAPEVSARPSATGRGMMLLI